MAKIDVAQRFSAFNGGANWYHELKLFAVLIQDLFKNGQYQAVSDLFKDYTFPYEPCLRAWLVEAYLDKELHGGHMQVSSAERTAAGFRNASEKVIGAARLMAAVGHPTHQANLGAMVKQLTASDALFHAWAILYFGKIDAAIFPVSAGRGYLYAVKNVSVHAEVLFATEAALSSDSGDANDFTNAFGQVRIHGNLFGELVCMGRLLDRLKTLSDDALLDAVMPSVQGVLGQVLAVTILYDLIKPKP